jgi:hybrid cluster-associated redox disulfide protein
MADKKKFIISKDTMIGEIVEKRPELAEKLAKKGFHCLGCPMSRMETLEQGAMTHGMDEKKIARLVEELNK